MLARLGRFTLTSLLLLLIAVSAGRAQEASARWLELNQELIAAYNAGDYARGVDLAEQALAVARAELGESHPDTLTSLNNLAALYERQGRYGEAEPLHEQALALRRETLGESHPDTLISLHNLAALHESQGRYDEAEPLYQQVLALRRATLGESHRDTLTSRNKLAGLCESQGRYGEAEPLYEQVLALRRATLGESHPDTLGSLNNLAFLYERQGRYGEAEPLYKLALAFFRETLGEAHSDTLTILNNLAWLYASQGRYGEAEPHLEQALALRRATLGETHPDTLQSLNNLAALYERQGRYDEAKPHYERALAAARAELGESHRDTLTIRSNLAGLYESQGRYSEAELLYEQVLALRRATLGEGHPDTLGSLNNLAFLYERQGRYGEAEPLYEQALALNRATLGEGHPQTLTSLKNLALLYASQGRYGEAEPLFEQALALSRQTLGETHPLTLRVQLNATSHLAAQGRYDEAEPLLRDTLRRSHARAMRELHAAAGRQQRQLALGDTVDPGRLAFSLARADPGRAALAAEAAVMLKSLGGTFEAALRRASRDLPPQDRHLIDELRAAVAERDAAEGVGETDRAKSAADRIDQLERQVAAKSPDFSAALAPVGWQDVGRALPEDATLIEYVVFEPVDFATGGPEAQRILAVLLARDVPPEVVDLGPLAALEAPLRAVLDPRRRENAAVLPQVRIELYQKLVEPLGARVTDAEQVIIAPDDVLHRVPFALLRPSREVQYWIEAQDLRVVPTGRVLLPRDGSDPAPHAVVFGGPDYGPVPERCAASEVKVAAVGAVPPVAARSATVTDGFCPLPGARQEALEVAQLLNERGLLVDPPYLDDAASEAALRALPDAPRVLHLATHGMDTEADYAAEPLARALLALAGANNHDGPPDNDGYLFGTDVSLLALQDTELVVLSACDTAHGAIAQGEGVMSLAHGFRLAGARNALMTLWTIDDNKARAFMKDFYGTWLSDEAAGPAAALRAVQRAWIKRNEPPEHWAAYVLVEQ